MKTKVCTTSVCQQKTDCLLIGVFEDDFSLPLLKELDKHLEGGLSQARRSGEFSGKTSESLLLHTAGRLPAARVLLVGLGKRDACRTDQLRQAAAQGVNQLNKTRLQSLATTLVLAELPGTTAADRGRAVAEGILLAGYRFDKYRTDDERRPEQLPETILLLMTSREEQEAVDREIVGARHTLRGVSLARDLVNEPGNIKSPSFLADQARRIAEETGITCQIMDRKALQGEGMGALLGVAQGSEREPCLITLEYSGGADDQPPVALVGKGVVFDSGGISIKPAEKMEEMKMDMAGAAAVLGTMLAAALLELPVNLIGVVPAVENMPSGSAIRPGDILTSLSGQTIEVINTDAEGRLILADALTYVQRRQPQLIIDLATLTGACIIALGHHASAVLGNDEGLIESLRKAGEDCGERVWPLPLWDDYFEQIKSNVADVKNTGGRPAGTITAAAFLKKFVQETRWAHLDIAGTAWREKATPEGPAGGSGVGVRLLITFLKQLAATE